jgi:hypothetical protein
MLLTEESERQTTVCGVAALFFTVCNIKDSLMHVKVGGNKVGSDLILIAEDEVVEA